MYRCLYRGVGVLYGEVTLGALVSGYRCLYRGVGVLYGEVTLGAPGFCVSLSVSGCRGPIM